MTSGVYDRQKHKDPPMTDSGLKGVYYEEVGAHGKPLTKPWKAYIRHHGLYWTLGYFATKEEAGRAYDKAALKVYGSDTFLNFPT